MSLAQAMATHADIRRESEAEEASWRADCTYLGMRAYPWHEWELWIAPGLHSSKRRSTCRHRWRADERRQGEHDPLDETMDERLCAAVGDTFQAYEYCSHGCGAIAMRGQRGQYLLSWQESVNPLSGSRRILYWLVEQHKGRGV